MTNDMRITRSIEQLCYAFATMKSDGHRVVSMRMTPRVVSDGSHKSFVAVLRDDASVEKVEVLSTGTSYVDRNIGDTKNSAAAALEGGNKLREDLERHASKGDPKYNYLVDLVWGKIHKEPTSLNKSLLGRGLLWLLADCFALYTLHERLCAKDATFFGAKGYDDCMKFKRNFLRVDLDNYDVDAIHEIDTSNNVIVAGFECLIPGKEGRGTDVAQFKTEDGELKVCRVEAIRHAGSIH